MKKFVLQVILSLALFAILFLNLFLNKSPDTLLALIAIVGYFVGSVLITRYKKPVNRNVSDAKLIVFGLSLLLITFFYLIGLKSGFLISYNSMFRKYITTFTWVKVFLIVIFAELSRYMVTLVRTKDKKQRWILDGLVFLMFILVDLTIVSKSYDYSSFSQLYEFIALVVLQSLSKNVILTLISKEYGFMPCIIYRFLIDLYGYFLPVVPKMNMFIEAVILLVFPYIIYVTIKKIIGKTKVEKIKQEKKYDKLVTILVTALFGVIVALVSREFSYCMIAIGSESMTGTTNKGDAIIYEVYDSASDKLKIGDIIVFTKNNVTIVHRIVNIYTVDGADIYKTKGDANESVDSWVVEKSDIVGMVKFRIVYIGWPSVWLSELF